MSSSPSADAVPLAASSVASAAAETAVPPQIPLTGSDCFLRAFDDEVCRYNGASHVSQLVLRLGPGFDLAAFEHTLAAATAAAPLVRAPIRRRFGVGLPVYRIDRAPRSPAPGLTVHEATGPRPTDTLPAVFDARMNDRFRGRRGELLRVDVVRYDGGAGGTDVAISWLHMLFDGAGSETFVERLEQLARGARAPSMLMTWTRPAGEREPLSTLGQRARVWRRHVDTLALRSPRSLAGPLARVPQRLRTRVDTLDTDETARATERARTLAGFLTPMLFYLAVTIRAHHRVYRARGLNPGSYVVPLPVNLRPKGVEGAVFRSHVSLLWFQVLPEQVDDLEGLIGELKQQRRRAIKEGFVEGGVAAMEFVRWLPKRLYARMTRRGFGGELCSFFFAYTDQFAPAIDTFFGAEILNGFHAPAVTPSPGSCLAMSLRGARLNVTHVYQAGVLSDDEVAAMRASARADLCGEAS